MGLSGAGRTVFMNRVVTGTFIAGKKSTQDESSPVIDINSIKVLFLSKRKLPEPSLTWFLKVQLVNPKTDEEVPLDNMPSLQGVDAFIFVYDVTDNDTFVQFSYWLEVYFSSNTVLIELSLDL